MLCFVHLSVHLSGYKMGEHNHDWFPTKPDLKCKRHEEKESLLYFLRSQTDRIWLKKNIQTFYIFCYKILKDRLQQSMLQNNRPGEILTVSINWALGQSMRSRQYHQPQFDAIN